MVRNITKTLIILTAVFLLNSLFAVRAEAASCAAVPISGNYTVSASCTFANTVDGVDAGSGTVNTAVLTVNSGQTLTVNSGQTIGFGSITNNGTILLNINKTAVLMNAPIWMIDADSDGYVASTTEYVQSSAPAGGRRRNVFTNISSIDCNDSNANVYQTITVYTDADNDGYTTSGSPVSTCVGPTSVINTRTYYKNASGSYSYITTSLGTDCLDSNANVYQNVASLQADADNDGYTVGTAATQCVGTTSSISGRTYYKDTSGAFTWLASASSLGTDCYDLNASAKPGQAAYFTAVRGASNDSAGNSGNSYDYNCNSTIDVNNTGTILGGTVFSGNGYNTNSCPTTRESISYTSSANANSSFTSAQCGTAQSNIYTGTYALTTACGPTVYNGANGTGKVGCH